MTSTPNRVDATTIRKALKAAGIDFPVRITSGRNTTYIARPSEFVTSTPLEDEQATSVLAALRPLWNDSDTRVRDSYGTVTVHRLGWVHTVPLETELTVLELNDVDPSRVRELREDSTHEERVAELAVTVKQPFELFYGPRPYRLSDLPNNARRLERLVQVGHDFQWVTAYPGVDGVVLGRYDYLQKLLQELHDYASKYPVQNVAGGRR